MPEMAAEQILFWVESPAERDCWAHIPIVQPAQRRCAGACVRFSAYGAKASRPDAYEICHYSVAAPVGPHTSMPPSWATARAAGYCRNRG